LDNGSVDTVLGFLLKVMPAMAAISAALVLLFALAYRPFSK
jgi:hypothetical protein